MQKLGGQETETESGVWLAQVGMSAFGGIHVLASLWLLSKAACLAYQQPKGHEARRVAVAASHRAGAVRSSVRESPWSPGVAGRTQAASLSGL